ncbi:MAG: AraC family transcriptional regulator [Bacteroidota bacterium]
MHREETITDYLVRINRVLEYIKSNLGEPMDIEKLASLSNFSKFHFHRIMSAHLNEPLYNYVIRLRMETAAHLLRHSNEPVGGIAYQVGYDTSAAFISAFGKRFGISPGEYRNGQEIIVTNNTNHKKIETMKNPKIKDIKPQKVIYTLCKGGYDKSAGEAWGKLCTFMKQKKLWGFSTKFIGIGYDDPSITETSKIRYEACVSIRKDVAPEGDIGVKTLAGGKYAVFRHNGPYEKFSETYNYIFSNWIAKSKAELRNVPCLEIYLNSPGKIKPENLKTDIYVPLK